MGFLRNSGGPQGSVGGKKVEMKGRNPKKKIIKGTNIQFSFSEVKRMSFCVMENLLIFLL